MAENGLAPLHGVRVVSCGGEIAAAYMSRLLADLGAEVVVVEPSGGSALRRRPPFTGGAEGGRGSACAGYFFGGMRSVVVDDHEWSGDLVAHLLVGADVVVHSDPRVPGEAQLARAERSNPGLVVVDISTFGGSGPLADAPGGDLMALAASGFLSMVTSDPALGPPVPIRPRGELSSVFAGCHAAIACLGALHARLAGGRGQRIEVSALETMVGTMATSLPAVTFAGTVPVAGGNRGVCPWAIFPCRDGEILLQCTEDQQWRALGHLLGDPDWAQLEIFETTAGRSEQEDVVNALVAEAIAAMPMEQFLEEAHERGVAACRLHTPADVLAWEHLRQRRSFRQIEMAEGSITVPAPPIRIRDVPEPATLEVPAVGADTATVCWDPRPGTAGDGPGAAPLAGLRVIDMTWVWAGPFATMQLAHLGADVIKIESQERVDVTRLLGPFADEAPGVNRSGYFNQYNQGKRSMCLDLRAVEGKAVLQQLIASADVIVDNMRPGALARLGFDDDALRRLNPRIVAVSMTGYGETGPDSDRMAYGSLIDALSGTTSMNGPVGGRATEIPMSLPDPCAGLHAALGTLAALYRARTSGIGADVECSMLEAWLAALPWGVVTQATAGRPPELPGTRDDVLCPHGTFRCAGEFAWAALAVETDAQFEALATAIGRPELAADERFATAAHRRVHETELEQLIAGWTVQHEPEVAVQALTAAGVPAGVVRTMDEVASCAHLAERRFFSALPHPEVGCKPVAGPPWRASGSRMRAATPAPMLGQHSTEVLRDVLGLDQDEIKLLIADGIVS